MRTPTPIARARSAAATLVRGGLGARVARLGPRPERPLIVYEFEACPLCRKVRQALSLLDLEAEIRPCPKRGTRFRPEAITQGGAARLRDRSQPAARAAERGVAPSGAREVCNHLERTYALPT